MDYTTVDIVPSFSVSLLNYGQGVTSAVENLLAAQGLRGIRSQTRTIYRCSVTTYFTIDDVEVTRRASLGATSIDDDELLSILAQLPLGVHTPFPFVDPSAWPGLLSAGSGVVRFDSEGLTRVAKSPCEIHAVSIAPLDWEAAANALTGFASAAPCLVDTDDPLTKLNASLFGFGLLSRGDVVMEPSATNPIDEARSWQLGERLYRSALPSPVLE